MSWLSAFVRWLRRRRPPIGTVPPTPALDSAAGLQCGFGEALGMYTLLAVRREGFTVVRLDLQQASFTQTTAFAREAVDAGLTPLCIIRTPEQLLYLPRGAWAELGNEPDLGNGWTVDTYLVAADRAVDIARQADLRLYLGAVSNLNKRGLAFLQRLPWRAWPSARCSVHRYPNGHLPTIPHAGMASRDDEVRRLRAIIGADRGWIVSECGYHEHEWTADEVALHMAWERRFFAQQGCELVVAYQIGDGPSTDYRDHYGFRGLDLAWKPVSKAFIKALEAS